MLLLQTMTVTLMMKMMRHGCDDDDDDDRDDDDDGGHDEENEDEEPHRGVDLIDDRWASSDQASSSILGPHRTRPRR